MEYIPSASASPGPQSGGSPGLRTLGLPQVGGSYLYRTQGLSRGVTKQSAPTPRLSGSKAQAGGPQLIGYLAILAASVWARFPLWAQLRPLAGKPSLLLALLSSLYFPGRYEFPSGCLLGLS